MLHLKGIIIIETVISALKNCSKLPTKLIHAKYKTLKYAVYPLCYAMLTQPIFQFNLIIYSHLKIFSIYSFFSVIRKSTKKLVT